MKDAIVSQYLAALEMLRQAVVRCPDDLWDDRAYTNVFWAIAYHALYYTHLYLQPTLEDMRPWDKHQEGYHRFTGLPAEGGYTKEEVLDYLALCRRQVEEQVSAVDLDAPSGFYWLPMDKLELQFYNLRHLHQHIGELCERLGTVGVSVEWVSRRRD